MLARAEPEAQAQLTKQVYRLERLKLPASAGMRIAEAAVRSVVFWPDIRREKAVDDGERGTAIPLLAGRRSREPRRCSLRGRRA
jgi:hypothetical protein